VQPTRAHNCTKTFYKGQRDLQEEEEEEEEASSLRSHIIALLNITKDI
jgi:hypothetical protein